MEKTELIELANAFIERSERYIEDAVKRKDNDDVNFYRGQKKAFTEFKTEMEKR